MTTTQCTILAEHAAPDDDQLLDISRWRSEMATMVRRREAMARQLAREDERRANVELLRNMAQGALGTPYGADIVTVLRTAILAIEARG